MCKVYETNTNRGEENGGPYPHVYEDAFHDKVEHQIAKKGEACQYHDYHFHKPRDGKYCPTLMQWKDKHYRDDQMNDWKAQVNDIQEHFHGFLSSEPTVLVFWKNQKEL